MQHINAPFTVTENQLWHPTMAFPSSPNMQRHSGMWRRIFGRVFKRRLCCLKLPRLECRCMATHSSRRLYRGHTTFPVFRTDGQIFRVMDEDIFPHKKNSLQCTNTLHCMMLLLHANAPINLQCQTAPALKFMGAKTVKEITNTFSDLSCCVSPKWEFSTQKSI